MVEIAAKQTDRQRQGRLRKNRVVEAEPVPHDAPVDGVPRRTLPMARAEIVEAGWEKVREGLEKAKADPSSDAYAMLEILCVNEFINAKMKIREYDAVELFRARNQGKELALKAAHLERQNELIEAKTEKLRLENRALKHKLVLVKKETLQARKAKGKPFNYDRALNQISAVIGLRGEEMFRHEKRPRQLS